jgi:hypothetical protein
MTYGIVLVFLIDFFAFVVEFFLIWVLIFIIDLNEKICQFNHHSFLYFEPTWVFTTISSVPGKGNWTGGYHRNVFENPTAGFA